MAKRKPEPSIEVTTYFDGENDATEIFTSLLVEKIRQKKEKNPLVKCVLTVHNIEEVPNHNASGLCG